jgi:hypothetical protein
MKEVFITFFAYILNIILTTILAVFTFGAIILFFKFIIWFMFLGLPRY